MRVLRQNLAIAQGFRPITARQRDTLLRRVAATARDGRFELYKISAAFDGNEARRQHGLPLMDELTAYPLSRTAAIVHAAQDCRPSDSYLLDSRPRIYPKSRDRSAST
jgi:hypothetical protein